MVHADFMLIERPKWLVSPFQSYGKDMEIDRKPMEINFEYLKSQYIVLTHPSNQIYEDERSLIIFA